MVPRQRPEAGYYAAANGASTDTTFFVPNYKRMVSGSNWLEYSALIVQNIGTSNANVTIDFYNRSGSKLLTLNPTIAPGAAPGFNSSSPGGIYDPLGTAFEGHAVVTSNQPLAVVLNGIIKSPGSGSATTNGVAQ